MVRCLALLPDYHPAPLSARTDGDEEDGSMYVGLVVVRGYREVEGAATGRRGPPGGGESVSVVQERAASIRSAAEQRDDFSVPER